MQRLTAGPRVESQWLLSASPKLNLCPHLPGWGGGASGRGGRRMRASEYFSLTQGWTLCAINVFGRMWPWYISVVTGKGLTNHFLVTFQAFSGGGNSFQVNLVKSPCPKRSWTLPGNLLLDLNRLNPSVRRGHSFQ